MKSSMTRFEAFRKFIALVKNTNIDWQPPLSVSDPPKQQVLELLSPFLLVD